MATAQRVANPKRGEVYLVNFAPTLGSEIKKTRPALILQNDIANRWSSITIVAAITSKYEDRLYPSEVLVRAPEGGLTVDSVVLLNQIRSIDKMRLIKRLGSLKVASMAKVDRALILSVGLAKI
jgi:mRNA interferase MazF